VILLRVRRLRIRAEGQLCVRQSRPLARTARRSSAGLPGLETLQFAPGPVDVDGYPVPFEPFDNEARHSSAASATRPWRSGKNAAL
jgi:hypothetical protein